MGNMNVYAFADEASASIDKQIEAMKRNGLQGLEIRNVDGVNVSDITLDKAKEVHEKMEAAGYAALPILNKRGEYRGTLTEGDLLWGIKNMCYMDMRQAEAHRIMEISRKKDNVPVRVTTTMHDLVDRASTQNFVPVVDDKDTFIGIVTRRAIIKYCSQRLFEEE